MPLGTPVDTPVGAPVDTPVGSVADKTSNTPMFTLKIIGESILVSFGVLMLLWALFLMVIFVGMFEAGGV